MGDLSRLQARRIALFAQGFGSKRPAGRVDRRHLRKVLDRIGLIQIDSVNVVARSQDLVVFSRLGAHPRSLIPDAAEAGELFEYWVHEACHVPIDQYPLYRWKMAEPHRWSGVGALADRRPGFVDSVIDRIREGGPIVAGDLRQRQGPKGAWWDWDDGKVVLEHLFQQGIVAATRRPSDFARVYDLTERVIPAEILDRPIVAESDARKELIVRAAAHHGIGTVNDLCDYHRLNRPATRPLVRELVEDGRLIETSVDGWDRPALMHPDAHLPRWVRARALLSPFDPVVWERDRAERMFGFRYRIEIYVPRPKRVFGYYVLPFLLGDELVARVDLKADRVTRRLLVQGAYGEPGIEESTVAHELAAELSEMAAWLGLDAGIVVGSRGDLAGALQGATRSTARVDDRGSDR